MPHQFQCNLVVNDATFLLKSPFLPPQECKGKESIVDSLVGNKTSKYVGSWIRRSQISKQKQMLSTSINCVIGYSTKYIFFYLHIIHLP